MENLILTQSALQRLLKCAQTKNIRQAYIFEGMKGIGKFTSACLFAQALHCTGKVKPCGVCPSCMKHKASTHSDLYITGEEGTVKVDDIRALSSELFIRPVLSDTKICIIKNGDSMNQDAQNALLKSFEEPPEYGVIIILSENVKNLLPTIRSRGLRITFEPFREEEIIKYIEKNYPEKIGDAPFIASYSGGVIGKCIEICENGEFFKKRNEIFEATRALTGDRLSIFNLADAFSVSSRKKGFADCDIYFDLFLSFMRDILALKTKGKVINTDKLNLLQEFSARVTLNCVIGIIEKTAKVRSSLNVSMKYDLWIVNMLINCWEDIHGKGSRS